MPVIVRQIDNPLEAERIIIESNRQRDKTPSEVMREAEQIERIFAEEAKRRMLAGVTEDGAGGRGKQKNPVATLPQGLGGDHKTRTKVAAAVGWKPRTMAKVKKVYDTANDATAPEPIRAVAQQQMAALDTGEGKRIEEEELPSCAARHRAPRQHSRRGPREGRPPTQRRLSSSSLSAIAERVATGHNIGACGS